MLQSKNSLWLQTSNVGLYNSAYLMIRIKNIQSYGARKMKKYKLYYGQVQVLNSSQG